MDDNCFGPSKLPESSSFRVVDPVVQRLGPPEGVGVVELQEVHALARVGVSA